MFLLEERESEASLVLKYKLLEKTVFLYTDVWKRYLQHVFFCQTFSMNCLHGRIIAFLESRRRAKGGMMEESRKTNSFECILGNHFGLPPTQ